MIYICPHVCYDVLCVWSNLVDIPPPWRFMDSHEMSGTTKCWLPLSIITLQIMKNYPPSSLVSLWLMWLNHVKPCETQFLRYGSYTYNRLGVPSLGSLSRPCHLLDLRIGAPTMVTVETYQGQIQHRWEIEGGACSVDDFHICKWWIVWKYPVSIECGITVSFRLVKHHIVQNFQFDQTCGIANNFLYLPVV